MALAEAHELHEPVLALAEGDGIRVGGLGACNPSGGGHPTALRIEKATYQSATAVKVAGFAYETLSETPLSPKLQEELGSRKKYSTCLPWVRVTRDPARFTACLTHARALGQVTSAEKIYEVLRADLIKEDQEVFVVVLLDTQCFVRAISEVARGTRDSVAVGIPDVLRVAVVEGATAMVICHNHPSGVVNPSDADKELTKVIQRAAQEVGIPLMDHVIFGPKTFFSFYDRGLLK